MTPIVETGTLVKLRREGGVAVLTLVRANMHNALVPELLEPVLASLEALHTDAAIRAVVLAAEGPAFSIGGDMRRFHAESALGAENLIAYSARLVGLLNRTILAMVNLPQPVIAAVHGTVTGGSIGFIAGADLVVMADDAVFKAHYANAGFCPDGGWTASMADLLGSRRTAAALLLNRSITAKDALDWGLATDLAPADQVLARALALASKIAGYAPGTMRYAKRLLAHDSASLAARLEAERRGFLELVGTDTARDGVARFLETFKNYPGGTL